MLLFLDTETTGLNPTEDRILEIAYVATSADTYNVFNPMQELIENNDLTPVIKSHLIEPDLKSWHKLDTDQFIHNMHTDNGLIDDLKFDPDLNLTMAEAQGAITSYVKDAQESYQDFGPVYLAGASVHFDLRFIEHHMPRLRGFLSHRVYDTSTLKAFFDGILNTDMIQNRGQHRAVNDVEETLLVANFMRTETEKLAKQMNTLRQIVLS